MSAILAIAAVAPAVLLRGGVLPVSDVMAVAPTPTPVPSLGLRGSFVLVDASPTPAYAASPTSTPLPPTATSVPPTPTRLPPTSTSTPTLTPTVTVVPTPRPTDSGIGIVRGNTERPWIALTFDSNHHSEPARSILETLRQRNVHCTYFVTGDSARRDPELVQEIVADGHELGNHSDTHIRFTDLTDEQIATQLAAVEELVIELTGHSTKPYFRAPHGVTSERVRRVVKENGYHTIYWTGHVGDWKQGATAESVLSYALHYACNGAILLLHASSYETAEALPQIIDELRARGYRLVTLSEVLAPWGGCSLAGGWPTA
jgi:peptidoglycan/xylan/chitin deacetylase (PgdA/CDA1 family)